MIGQVLFLFVVKIVPSCPLGLQTRTQDPLHLARFQNMLYSNWPFYLFIYFDYFMYLFCTDNFPFPVPTGTVLIISEYSKAMKTAPRSRASTQS